MMARIRIEVGPDLQFISCETCGWSTFGFMNRHCPQCGVEFNEVRLLVGDEVYYGKKPETEGAA